MGHMDAAPTTPPAGDIPRGPLTRSSRSRVLAGVAGGLGEHTGLDPLVFRLGFVALTIFGGLGLLLYGLAWITIPGPSGTRTYRRMLGSIPRVLLFALVAWAGYLFLRDSGLLFSSYSRWSSGSVLAFALIVTGIVLLREERNLPASAARDDDGLSRLWLRRAERKRSPLGWLTIAVALLAVGVAGLLNNTGATTLPPGRYLAVALTVIGLGLVVAARYGSARFLVLVGLLLLPLAFVASPIEMPLRGRIASFYLSPRTADEIEPRYDVLLGDVVLDLGQLRRQELTRSINVEINAVAGHVTAYVPEWMDLTVSGKIDVGSYYSFAGTHDSGVDLELDQTAEGTKNEGSFSLDLRGGFVAVNIVRLDDREIWASQFQRARREAARQARIERRERRRERRREARQERQQSEERRARREGRRNERPGRRDG